MKLLCAIGLHSMETEDGQMRCVRCGRTKDAPFDPRDVDLRIQPRTPESNAPARPTGSRKDSQ